VRAGDWQTGQFLDRLNLGAGQVVQVDDHNVWVHRLWFLVGRSPACAGLTLGPSCHLNPTFL
jgi:hypothetical protein